MKCVLSCIEVEIGKVTAYLRWLALDGDAHSSWERPGKELRGRKLVPSLVVLLVTEVSGSRRLGIFASIKNSHVNCPLLPSAESAIFLEVRVTGTDER